MRSLRLSVSHQPGQGLALLPISVYAGILQANVAGWEACFGGIAGDTVENEATRKMAQS